MYHLFQFSDQQTIIGNLTNNSGRVSVDNHLTKGVVLANRFVNIYRDVLQEFEHRRNPLWVDTIFRFLQAK
ncbi:MAG: hypothetical protein A3F84_01315 [Candidatus Handelsmanbacteria bacterium RIFCSPLOWO2_12_FULL_64_10]|uniref:Uncharacterized protein n=1 Tax=Handelsmanbacteria sp. (strain RIFCSPLOWO2_12_FULL_64_10) TaxID=1817868 RepID=A0A1F6D3R9_HANXR|nr:MAG: hypothetical protein A3F84_01315 [Candidatus Handelsmanbacteria bacterium RIFCSPLOWO2_12_FULL_64_10]